MTKPCTLCERRIKNDAGLFCGVCREMGPYGHSNYLAAIYGCSGNNHRGKPCKQWAIQGEQYCKYHIGKE